MAEPIVAEAPPAPDPNPNFCTEFDCLPIPSDPLFLSGPDQAPSEPLASDLGFSLEDNADFELTFDFDEFYFPSEDEPLLIPSATQGDIGNSSPESGKSVISGDRGCEDVDKYLNCWSSESGGCNRESSQDSVDRCPNEDAKMNFHSPASSQVSGNGGSAVSEAMHASSPESANLAVDQNIKLEDEGMSSVPKRKKEGEDASSEFSRSSKYRRSTDNVAGSAIDEDEKRKARLMRNRESAQLSRQRKKHYVEELEEKVRSMHSTIADLNSKISYFMAENATLRQQMSGATGMCPPTHPPCPPGIYPPVGPMPYSWMPCAPYMVKPQGSQVPLVPIPRLKPQQPVSASKPKKAESKKSEGKTKKVASISFLGVLFFIFLFGGLVPLIDFNFGGIGEFRSSYFAGGSYVQYRGNVLTVNGHENISDGSTGIHFSNSNRAHHERCRDGVSGCQNSGGSASRDSGSENSVPAMNASEPLVASLYVPRNDKLVKIDGNLIIHSVLASEKALAQSTPERNNKGDTSLAIPRDFSPALAIPDVGRNRGVHPHVYRNTNVKQKALSSGSADTLKDHFKSTAANGKLQQWFREGVAGPMLSSGMCTEVFQFDTSPASAPGAIIPASSTANISAEHQQNATRSNRGRNRRILHGLPVPIPNTDYNISKDNRKNNSQKESFQGNKSASSMVVSILVDPREAGDGDIDGMMAPKSLSRIFVVVLIDSVKYVTYSCVVPHSGPHLVTT